MISGLARILGNLSLPLQSLGKSGKPSTRTGGTFIFLTVGSPSSPKISNTTTNRSEFVSVLDETEEEKHLFGILDGGNTNARINKWREELENDAVERVGEAFVNMQILIPHLRGMSQALRCSNC